MRRKRQCIKWLYGSILGGFTLFPASFGQASLAVPVTTDWSHQHVIFSSRDGGTGQEGGAGPELKQQHRQSSARVSGDVFAPESPVVSQAN